MKSSAVKCYGSLGTCRIHLSGAFSTISNSKIQKSHYTRNEEFCLLFLHNFLITLAYSSTMFLYLFFLCQFCRPLPKCPVQQADRSQLCPSLRSQSRRPTAIRRPCATGRHGSPTNTIGYHCHLPCNDGLPALLRGAIAPHQRWPRASVLSLCPSVFFY